MLKARIRWFLIRLRERAAFKLAWALPRWLVYFAAIRLVAHGTSGEYDTTNPTYLGAMDALKRWGEPF